MSRARRVKRQPANPTSPLTGRGQKDEDSTSSGKSIEIFRDHSATLIPVYKTEAPEINYLKLLVSDNESSPTCIQVPGLTCSTPVTDNFNNIFFINASAVISPIAHATQYPTHSKKPKIKKSPASNIKPINLCEDLKEKYSFMKVEEVTQYNGNDKTQNEVCNKGPEVLKDVKITALPIEKAVAKPSIKPPSSYPVCPLIHLKKTPRLGGTIQMRRSITKDNKRPHEYPQCPLETLNFRRNPKRATVKDEPP